MFLSRLAARNLWRAKGRTALTAVAIIASVAVAILAKGFMDGAAESIVRGAIDGTVGHVEARPKGYPTDSGEHPVDVLLHVTPAARMLLDHNTVAWTERTYFAPLLVHGRDAVRVTAIGFDPKRDGAVFPRTRWKVKGKLPGADATEVALTPKLADLLKVHPGDRITLETRTHAGAMNALEATVSGIVRTGNVALDAWTVWAPSPFADALIHSKLPSHISARLAHRGQAAAFAKKLSAALGAQAEVVTWKSETADLLRVMKVKQQSMNVVVGVLLALAALGIANTLLMAVHERTREVGTLRALGLSEGGVARLFLLEGLFLGVGGGAVGALVGGGIVARWARHPLDFSQLYAKSGASFSASTWVYGHFSASAIAGAVAVGVLVAVLASIYPARVAARRAPAEAVRADG